MTPAATLRSRRNAAQRHALATLEREISATDPYTRRKYLRDFHAAFRNYESVLNPEQLRDFYSHRDLVLVGDYHALPRSQKFAAGLLAQLASQSPLVLGLEILFSRDQDVLETWWRQEISEQEFRQRIHFDLEWGYDWAPFYNLLATARSLRVPIYGLDCVPRNDLRRIGLRDRHAAHMIARIRERHPQAVVLVLFGESHLAPTHLPQLLRTLRPQDRLLTVLQNIDSLYWRAAGERAEWVDAVKVSSDVICVFNSTPLEKYESYRLCLERWRQEHTDPPDLAPAFYNLVDALLRFLNLGKYSPSTGTQPAVEQLPEICFRPTGDRVRSLLLRCGSDEDEIKWVGMRLEKRGCCFVPQCRTLLMRDLELVSGAEEAARFLHHACRNSGDRCADESQAGSGGKKRLPSSPEDTFYTRVLEHALAYFGSRALYPARPAVREASLHGLYSLSHRAIQELGLGSSRDFLRTVDFLVLHKNYEANLHQYRERPSLLEQGLRCRGGMFHYATLQLGYLLGSELYDAYVSGRISKRLLRSLFFRSLDKPGTARTIYFVTQRKLRNRKRRT
jgi:hypothetical protein